MTRRSLIAVPGVLLLTSCTRHARTERMMTWEERSEWHGMSLRQGERVIVFRFVEDASQGIVEDWTSDLHSRLLKLGNPVRVTFDCSRQFGGTFGYNEVALNGEPWFPGGSSTGAPTRAGSFSEGPPRPNPLESSLPR